MDVVYERSAGLAVHPKTVVACRIYRHESGSKVKESATFETMPDRLLQLRAWLKQAAIEVIAMASTGVYWKPIYTILEEAFQILVVNAAHMKAVSGRKTDVKEAEWKADLLRHGLLKGSFMPPTAQRDVRELTRLRSSVVAEGSRAVNRLQKILEQANLNLASVVTAVTGTSARARLNALVVGTTDEHALADLAQGRLRDKRDLLERALQGRVRDIHRFRLADALAQIDDYDERIQRLTQEIDRLLRPFEQTLVQLDTIPGVGRIVADTIRAEVGTDLSRLPDQHHLASWAGLVPGNKVRGGQPLSASLRKGPPALKPTLVQAAPAAIRPQHPYLSATYHRIAARRGKKRAIIAVARSILQIAFFILRDGTPYRELGADSFDQPHPERTLRRLTQRLNRLGLDVTLAECPPQLPVAYPFVRRAGHGRSTPTTKG
jgi:transposase